MIDLIDLRTLILVLFVYLVLGFFGGFAVTFVLVYLLARKAPPYFRFEPIRSKLLAALLALLFAVPGGLVGQELVQWGIAEYTERENREFLEKRRAFGTRQLDRFGISSVKVISGDPEKACHESATPVGSTRPQDFDTGTRWGKVTYLVPRRGRYFVTIIGTKRNERLLRQNHYLRYKLEDKGDLIVEEDLAEEDARAGPAKNTACFMVKEDAPVRPGDEIDLSFHVWAMDPVQQLRNTRDGFFVTNPGVGEMTEAANYQSSAYHDPCDPAMACARDGRLHFEIP